MQQRYYDPVAARFMSVDPITTDANTGSSFNRYEYAHNNPYRYTDPNGRDPWYQEPTQTVIKQQVTGSNILQRTTITSTPGGATTVSTSGPLGSGMAAMKSTIANWLSGSWAAAKADGFGGAIEMTLAGIPGEAAVIGAIGKLGKAEAAAAAATAAETAF